MEVIRIYAQNQQSYWWAMTYRSFEGYNVDVYYKMVESWVDDYVIVKPFLFDITSILLVDIYGLVDEDLNIMRDKHPQKMELDLFSSLERIGWDGKHILWEGLPQLWLKVARKIMNYFTLET